MSASSASKWIRYTWRRDGVRLVYYRLYCGARTLYTLVCPALVRLSRNNESGNREFEAEYALAGEMDDGRVPLTAAETMAKTTHDLNDLAAKKMAHLIWKRATRHFDGVGPAFYRLIGGARTLYTLVRPPLVGCLSSWFNDGELGDREFEAEYALAGEMDDGRVPLTATEKLAKTTDNLNDLALPSDATVDTASALPSVDPKADNILEMAATAHDRPASNTIVPAKKQRTEGPASRSVNTQTDALPEPVATITLAEHQQAIDRLQQTIKALEQAALAARPTIKNKKTGGGAGSDIKRNQTADSELASDTIAGKYGGKQCEGTDCNARIAPRDQLRLYRDLHMFLVLSSGTLVDDDFVLSKSSMLAPGGKKVMKGWKMKDKDMGDYKVIDAIMTRMAAGRMGMPATWEAYKAVRKTSGAICKDCWAKVVHKM